MSDIIEDQDASRADTRPQPPKDDGGATLVALREH